MDRMKFFLFGVILSCFFQTNAQTCSIKVNQKLERYKDNFQKEIKLFLSLEFEINGVKLSSNDTNSILVPITKNGFDSVYYSYTDQNGKNFDESFICKLKTNEKYIISPCTCCGIFLMTPSKNAKRGFVKFVNKSFHKYITSPSTYFYDTLQKRTFVDFKPSSISMNCGFRPNKIVAHKFNYEPKKESGWVCRSFRKLDRLQKRRKRRIVFEVNYLFLHEEKLVVTINKRGKKIKLELVE